MRRFFCQVSAESQDVTLDGSEAHHLIHVLRAQPGDRVQLFDGRGVEFDAEVAKIGRREATLRIVDRRDVDRELPCPLIVAVALPRGERQDWLVQKAVEVGVTDLVPWHTERSVARPNAKTLSRLERTIVEASKQCRRNRLMSLHPPVSLADGLRVEFAGRSCFAHIDSQAATLSTIVARTADDTLAHGLRIAVGPEGGWSDREVSLVKEAGWQPIRLTPSVMRTETAVVAAAAHAALLMLERCG